MVNGRIEGYIPREESHCVSREAPLVQIGAVSAAVSSAPLRGRLATYSLRVSLLEQCQLRCGYCLPGAVQPYTKSEARLRPTEYAVLARAFAAVGVDKVRFTGGEPLLREDIVEVIMAFHAGLPHAHLALTTNGLRLDVFAEALAAAGLSRVTVHLDTLQRDRYPQLMGRGDPALVLEQAERALTLFSEVKLNVVVQRGLNDDELLDFLALSRRTGIEVRFIELMDTGSAHAHVEQTFLSGRDIVARVAAARPLSSLPRRRPSDPARLFRCDDDGTIFGLIASDTEPFCDDCDRLRLTADGRLRGCLYEPGGVSLAGALAAGPTAVEDRIRRGLDEKRPHHPSVMSARTPFSMADVGG